jgi:hypothetical protein
MSFCSLLSAAVVFSFPRNPSKKRFASTNAWESCLLNFFLRLLLPLFCSLVLLSVLLVVEVEVEVEGEVEVEVEVEVEDAMEIDAVVGVFTSSDETEGSELGGCAEVPKDVVDKLDCDEPAAVVLLTDDDEE